MDYTEIILAVIAVIGAVVTGVLIPWIKSKMDEGQLAKLDFWLRIFIAAAETAYGSGMGQEKKAYVIAKIKALGFDFDDEIVSDAIEALCRELTAEDIINNDGEE